MKKDQMSDIITACSSMSQQDEYSRRIKLNKSINSHQSKQAIIFNEH